LLLNIVLEVKSKSTHIFIKLKIRKKTATKFYAAQGLDFHVSIRSRLFLLEKYKLVKNAVFPLHANAADVTAAITPLSDGQSFPGCWFFRNTSIHTNLFPCEDLIRWFSLEANFSKTLTRQVSFLLISLSTKLFVPSDSSRPGHRPISWPLLLRFVS